MISPIPQEECTNPECTRRRQDLLDVAKNAGNRADRAERALRLQSEAIGRLFAAAPDAADALRSVVDPAQLSLLDLEGAKP